MFIVKKKMALNFILILSVAILSIAYFIQYILGYEPCNLCLIERIPYWASIILIIFFLIFKNHQKVISIIILLFFIFGFFVSFYHVGIEQGFISESLVCDLEKNDINATAQQLLSNLEKKTISCKNVEIKIFGLSLATINTLISLILSAIMLKIVFKNETH